MNSVILTDNFFIVGTTYEEQIDVGSIKYKELFR